MQGHTVGQAASATAPPPGSGPPRATMTSPPAGGTRVLWKRRRTRPRRAGRMQAASAQGPLCVGLRCAEACGPVAVWRSGEASRRAAQAVVGPSWPVCSRLASHPPCRRPQAQSPRRFQRAWAKSARRVRAIQTVTSPAASRRLIGCRNPWTSPADPVRPPGRRDCRWRHRRVPAWTGRAIRGRVTTPRRHSRSVAAARPHERARARARLIGLARAAAAKVRFLKARMGGRSGVRRGGQAPMAIRHQCAALLTFCVSVRITGCYPFEWPWVCSR